ncbi:MAG: thioesterase family protein [Cyclobacteriaceae bacterium]
MYQHEFQVRVRYSETDQMGFVYYGNYAAYYEVARVEAFRAIGWSYKKMEEEGIGMPVLGMNIKYYGPAKYDELLTVKVSIPEQPRARVKFVYEITNANGKLINAAETELAFMNMNSGRPARIPKELHELLSKYYT